mmetsp:Transcript_12031/g.14326  ORF Transcript_12031/g.14326 Transcript_12031/m.14326 type:complete len:526 (-) Transcript_12031:220-1797(-)
MSSAVSLPTDRTFITISIRTPIPAPVPDAIIKRRNPRLGTSFHLTPLPPPVAPAERLRTPRQVLHQRGAVRIVAQRMGSTFGRGIKDHSGASRSRAAVRRMVQSVMPLTHPFALPGRLHRLAKLHARLLARCHLAHSVKLTRRVLPIARRRCARRKRTQPRVLCTEMGPTPNRKPLIAVPSFMAHIHQPPDLIPPQMRRAIVKLVPLRHPFRALFNQTLLPVLPAMSLAVQLNRTEALPHHLLHPLPLRAILRALPVLWILSTRRVRGRVRRAQELHLPNPMLARVHRAIAPQLKSSMHRAHITIPRGGIVASLVHAFPGEALDRRIVLGAIRGSIAHLLTSRLLAHMLRTERVVLVSNNRRTRKQQTLLLRLQRILHRLFLSPGFLFLLLLLLLRRTFLLIFLLLLIALPLRLLHDRLAQHRSVLEHHQRVYNLNLHSSNTTTTTTLPLLCPLLSHLLRLTPRRPLPTSSTVGSLRHLPHFLRHLQHLHLRGRLSLRLRLLCILIHVHLLHISISALLGLRELL